MRANSMAIAQPVSGSSRSGRVLTLALLLAVATGCKPSAIAADNDNKVDLESDIEKASYFLGYQQATSVKQGTGGVVDLQAYLAGVRDVVADNPNLVNSDAQRIMQAFNEAVVAQREQEAAGAVSEGDAYRAEFAAKPGVVSLPSGLLYEVLVEGTGAKPGPTDTVSTHYHGTLTDGTIFDSSVQRGQPASFRVDGVIRGWTEALQLMPVGSKWRLVIPPELAYGERGAGASIPPHATLEFEVELLEIK